MKRFITRINGFCDQDMKRKQELVSSSAHASGWLDMALYVYINSSESYESRSARFDGIIAGMEAGDIVVVQLPTGNGHTWEQQLISHIKTYGGTVLVYLHSLENSFHDYFDSVQDTIYTCNYQKAIIVDSFPIRTQLYQHGLLKKKQVFVCEEANDWFDAAYYIAKTLNLACESVLLGDNCKYQLIQKDIERSNADNKFTYFAARVSYGGKHAISFRYTGDADLIMIKTGDRIIWQTDRIETHYALVEPETSYTIHAAVYTQSGKLSIAATEKFEVNMPFYQEDAPKISLIIPMYNSSRFIVRTIDSVLGQSQEDIELVLVDDESTDNTVEIVEWYRQIYPSIQLIQKKNGGQGSARNVGIDFAHGQFITFMDHDDTLPPDAQKILYDLITTTNTDIGIGTIKTVISEEGGLLSYSTHEQTEVLNVDTYMSTHSPVMIWDKIYNADLCKKIPFGPRYHEDNSWSPIIFSFANSVSLTSEIVYEFDRTTATQSTSYLTRSEDWFHETYCTAVKDALDRCNPEKITFVKKMILSCASFDYRPKLREVVRKLVESHCAATAEQHLSK